MLKAAKAQEKVLKYVRDELDCQEREDVRDVLHKYRTWTAGQWRVKVSVLLGAPDRSRARWPARLFRYRNAWESWNGRGVLQGDRL